MRDTDSVGLTVRGKPMVEERASAGQEGTGEAKVGGTSREARATQMEDLSQPFGLIHQHHTQPLDDNIMVMEETSLELNSRDIHS